MTCYFSVRNTHTSLEREQKWWFFPLKNLMKRWHPPFKIVHELGEARHLLLEFCRLAGPIVFHLKKLVCRRSVMVTSSVADPGCLTRIPDLFFFSPGSEFFPFRIPDPHQRILVFLSKKLFLSSRKDDPGCSSRIRILIVYPSRIPDPGIKKAPDPGSGTPVKRRKSE